MKYYCIIDNKKVLVSIGDDNKSPIIDPNKRNLVKIIAQDRYYITNCGSVEWLCKNVGRAYKAYSKGTIKPEDLHLKLVRYCYKNDIKILIIEPIYSSENGYEILKKELDILVDCFGKKECLNSNNIPYIPKTVHAKKGSNWLKQNEYLNFMKLLKNYEY